MYADKKSISALDHEAKNEDLHTVCRNLKHIKCETWGILFRCSKKPLSTRSIRSVWVMVQSHMDLIRFSGTSNCIRCAMPLIDDKHWTMRSTQLRNDSEREREEGGGTAYRRAVKANVFSNPYAILNIALAYNCNKASWKASRCFCNRCFAANYKMSSSRIRLLWAYILQSVTFSHLFYSY